MPCKVATQIPDETTRYNPQKKINQQTCSKTQNFKATDIKVHQWMEASSTYFQPSQSISLRFTIILSSHNFSGGR